VAQLLRQLPIDGAAAWVIILRVVRSMIETAGVVQTPNDECSRTPMSNNRQWTEEVVVVYCVSTPTSAGLVNAFQAGTTHAAGSLSASGVRHWYSIPIRTCLPYGTLAQHAQPYVSEQARGGRATGLCCAFHRRVLGGGEVRPLGRMMFAFHRRVSAVKKSGRSGPDDDLGCAFHRLARRWRSLICPATPDRMMY